MTKYFPTYSDDQIARYRAEGHWNNEDLGAAVWAMATAAPNRIAVIDGSDGREATYAELLDDSRRVAGYFASHGLGPGSTISVQLPNRYHSVVVALAVLLIGGRLNPLLPNYRLKELRYVLSASETTCLVTPAHYRGFDHLRLADDVLSGLGSLPLHLVVDGEPSKGRSNIDDALAGDPLAEPEGVVGDASEIVFTSGTESAPKGIVHSEETLNHSVRVSYHHLGMTDDDVVWMPSPIGHSTGLNFGVRMALLHGLPIVLQDVWDAEVARRLISTYRPTYTLAATTFLADLLRHSRTDELASLNRFGCGGAPVPAELVRAADRSGVTVLRIYGSTEALIVSWCSQTSDLRKRVETDGLVLPTTQVQIRNRAGEVLGPGAEGEIYVRSPSLCIGVLAGDEGAEPPVGLDGWLRSGDLGVLDVDRHLSVVGRVKEIVIRGGMNIAPRELEDLLSDMPGVADVAVIGLPDERLGEKVCACIVRDTTPDVTVDVPSVSAFLESRGVAKYKLPQNVHVVAALPRTASGKVQKYQLVDQVSALARKE